MVTERRYPNLKIGEALQGQNINYGTNNTVRFATAITWSINLSNKKAKKAY